MTSNNLLVESQFNFNFDDLQKILHLIKKHKAFFIFDDRKLNEYKSLVKYIFDIFFRKYCKLFNIEFIYDIDNDIINISSLYNGEYWVIGYISHAYFNFTNLSVLEINSIVNAINNNFEVESKLFKQICDAFESVE